MAKGAEPTAWQGQGSRGQFVRIGRGGIGGVVLRLARNIRPTGPPGDDAAEAAWRQTNLTWGHGGPPRGAE
jgi:hypothetical protein